MTRDGFSGEVQCAAVLGGKVSRQPHSGGKTGYKHGRWSNGASATGNGYAPSNSGSKGGASRAQQTRVQQSNKMINRQVTRVAELGDLTKLLEAIDSFLPEMNGINLATSIHRVAKLASTGYIEEKLERLTRNPVFQRLFDMIVHHISKHSLRPSSGSADIRTNGDPGEMPVQCMSIVTWSCASLRISNEPLFSSIVSIVTPRLDQLKPFELSNLLWAYAKLSLCSGELFKGVTECLLRRKDSEFKAQCLSTIAWSFATAKRRNASVFESIAEELIVHVAEVKPQEIANSLWAYAKSRCCHGPLFQALGDAAIANSMIWNFKPQELSNSIWAFATVGLHHAELFRQIEEVVIRKRHDLAPQNVANILWAYAKLQIVPSSSLFTLLLTVSSSKLPQHKPQELSAIIWASAQMCPTCTEFFGLAARGCATRLHEFSPNALANLAKAFATVETDVPSFFGAIVQESVRRLPRFEPLALCNLLRATFEASFNRTLHVHTLGNEHGAAVVSIAEHIMARIREFRVSELQHVQRSLQIQMPGQRAASIMKLEAAVGAAVMMMSETSSEVAHDRGRKGTSVGTYSSRDSSDEEDMSWPLLSEFEGKAVPNFEGCGMGGRPRATSTATTGSAAGSSPCQSSAGLSHESSPMSLPAAEPLHPGASLALPPGLENLENLPPAKFGTTPEFEQYRVAYRNFRLGHASGARGEVSDVQATILEDQPSSSTSAWIERAGERGSQDRGGRRTRRRAGHNAVTHSTGSARLGTQSQEQNRDYSFEPRTMSTPPAYIGCPISQNSPISQTVSTPTSQRADEPMRVALPSMCLPSPASARYGLLSNSRSTFDQQCDHFDGVEVTSSSCFSVPLERADRPDSKCEEHETEECTAFLPTVDAACLEEPGLDSSWHTFDLVSAAVSEQLRNGRSAVILGAGTRKIVRLRCGLIDERVALKRIPAVTAAMLRSVDEAQQSHVRVLRPIARISTDVLRTKVAQADELRNCFIAYPLCVHGNVAEWFSSRQTPLTSALCARLARGVLFGAEALLSDSTAAISAVQPDEIFVDANEEPWLRAPLPGRPGGWQDALKWMSPEEVGGALEANGECNRWPALSFRLGLLLYCLGTNTMDPYPQMRGEQVLLEMLKELRGAQVPLRPDMSAYRGPEILGRMVAACLRIDSQGPPERQAFAAVLEVLATLE